MNRMRVALLAAVAMAVVPAAAQAEEQERHRDRDDRGAQQAPARPAPPAMRAPQAPPLPQAGHGAPPAADAGRGFAFGRSGGPGDQRPQWQGNRGNWGGNNAPRGDDRPAVSQQPGAPAQAWQGRDQGRRDYRGADNRVVQSGDRRDGNRQWNNGDRRGDGVRQWNNGDRRWDNDSRQGSNGDRRWDNNVRQWNDNDRRVDGARQWNNGDRRWDNNNRQWNGNNRQWNGNDRRFDNNRRGYRPDPSWRNDHRYDWRGWRENHRDLFRWRYAAPHGYNYRPVYRGFYLEPFFYGSSYWLSDPYEYRLPPVEWPLRWVRYYDNAILVDVTTGEVVDVIEDFFF